MEKLGIRLTAILLALITVANGRPTSSNEAENNVSEIKNARLEVELYRNSKPCYASQLEIRTDIKQAGKIMDVRNLRYVPECQEDGIKWKSSQCGHENGGSCFCVREENGQVVEGTINRDLNKEALDCGRRWVNAEQNCFQMRDKFDYIKKEFGLSGQSPLPYYPDCASEGKFKAMQQNELAMHFCVDTKTGDIIPETVTYPGQRPPLTEQICQAFDIVWQEFKSWNESHSAENEVTERSCRNGFTFVECGCPRVCTHTTTFESLEEEGCPVCKPACVCPKGKVELNGRCVSLEECNEEKPASTIAQADKLEQLTNGNFAKWKEFMENNPNAVLETYVQLDEERRSSESAAMAYDDSNDKTGFPGVPPSEEPESEVQEEEQYAAPVGAENVIDYYGTPLFLAVFGGGLTPEEVQEVIETGTVGPYPPQEFEAVPTESGTEFISEEEHQDAGSEPEEDGEHESNEWIEEESFSETEENTMNEMFSEEDLWLIGGEEEEFPENEEEFSEIAEEAFNPEESFSPEEEEFFTEEEEEYTNRDGFPEEENTVESSENIREEEVQEEDEFQTTGPYEEDLVETVSIPSKSEEHASSPMEEESENLPELESENVPEEESYSEPEEPENEVDNRMTELSDRQAEFSSVPSPKYDEAHNHQATTPCEKVHPPTTSPDVEDDTEEEEAEIDRVLIENGVIPPKPIEASLQQQNQSVKKNSR